VNVISTLHVAWLLCKKFFSYKNMAHNDVVLSVSILEMRGTLLLLLLAFSGAFASENVLHLTAENFDEAVQEHAFLVVEFFAPWCGHCTTLAPEWEQAATTLMADTTATTYGIRLAAVDATVHASLAGKFAVQGFPTIKIFEGHSVVNPSAYDGPRQAAGIVEFLLKRAAPASSEVVSEEEAASLLEAGVVVVVYSAEPEEWWLDLAKSKRDVVSWRHTTNEAVMRTFGVEAGTITMLKNFEETTTVYKGDTGLLNLDEIAAFVDYHRSQVGVLIKKGDQEALKIVFEPDKRPNLFLFTNRMDKGLEAFATAAQDVRGKFVSVRFHDSDFADAFKHFGLEQYIGEATLPKVLIEDRKNEKNFLLEGDVDEASVERFISDFQDGKLEPMVK